MTSADVAAVGGLETRRVEWRISDEPVAYDHAMAVMEERVAAIRAGSGTQFDPEVVVAFLDVAGELESLS